MKCVTDTVRQFSCRGFGPRNKKTSPKAGLMELPCRFELPVVRCLDGQPITVAIEYALRAEVGSSCCIILS